MKRLATILLVLTLVLVGQLGAAQTGESTVIYSDDDGGVRYDTQADDFMPGFLDAPLHQPLDCDILWNYHLPNGNPMPHQVDIGFNNTYVWQGGSYGDAHLFDLTGDGTPLWAFEVNGHTRFRTAAAETASIFYGASYNISTQEFLVHKFNHSSNVPDWSWDGGASDYVPGAHDFTLMTAIDCSTDGSVMALAGSDGDSLVVLFFHDDSSTPFMVFEDETNSSQPHDINLSDDGSKCIFIASSTIYRVDVATGVAEATIDLGYTTYCLGVSPDASVIVTGWMNGRVLSWTGSAYENEFYCYKSGFYAGKTAVAADNDEFVIFWYSSDYQTTELQRFSLAAGSTPVWSWESNTGNGNLKNCPSWIELSDDGEWIVVGSWGTENNVDDEVLVFKDSSPAGTWFSIDTPGSVFTVDISDDGQYIVSGSKAIHAEQFGNGGDVYAVYIDPSSAIESVDLFANVRDEGVLLSWSILGDEPLSVSVLRSVNENQPIALSGELSGSATSWLDVSGSAGAEYAYWLEVTELDGTISRFGPSEIIVPGAVSELNLNDPYPNPASSALTISISYELAVEGAVSLSVYDLSGRLVETLVSGEQTAGRHSVNWNSSTSATGVYLLRLEAAGEAITRRAVISR